MDFYKAMIMKVSAENKLYLLANHCYHILWSQVD